MSSPLRYKGYIRFRVGGILEDNGKLLLVKLRSPISNTNIWIPPGGGVNFGESAEHALIREFKEETNLRVTVCGLLHVNEIIEGDFHVIEHFYRVKLLGGKLRLGSDPEHENDKQLLSDIGFFNQHQIQVINCKPLFITEQYWQSSERQLFNSQG